MKIQKKINFTASLFASALVALTINTTESALASTKTQFIPEYYDSLNSGTDWQGASVVIGDFDRDGIHVGNVVLPGNGARKSFSLGKRPIHRILSVQADGVSLTPAQYAVDRDTGRITFAPIVASQAIVSFEYSTDLDIESCNNGTANRAYRNDGVDATGKLVITPLPGIPTVTTCNEMKTLDIDGDGNLDVLVAAMPSQVKFYRNPPPSGPLASGSIPLLPGVQPLSVSGGNIDGDVNDELIMGEDYGGGTGAVFAYKYDSSLAPFYSRQIWTRRLPGKVSSVSLGDYDLDGKLDLLTGESIPGVPPTPRLSLWHNESAQGPFIYAISNIIAHQFLVINTPTGRVVSSTISGWTAGDQLNFLWAIATDDQSIWMEALNNIDGKGYLLKVDKASMDVRNRWQVPALLGPVVHALATSPTSVYVANSLWIEQFDKTTYAVQGSTFSALGNFMGLAVGNGFVYAVKQSVASVVKLNPNLSATGVSRVLGSYPINQLQGIACANDAVYVTDRQNKTVTKLSTDTLTAMASIGGFTDPFGVAVAPDGTIWVSDGASLKHYDSSFVSLPPINLPFNAPYNDPLLSMGPIATSPGVDSPIIFGDPVWTSMAVVIPGQSVWDDLNGDGKQDFAVAAAAKGNSTLTNQFFLATNTSPDAPTFNIGAMGALSNPIGRGIATGDFDGDANINLVSADYYDSTWPLCPALNVFVNSGGASPLFNADFDSSMVTDPNVPSYFGYSVAVGDMNNDGALDLVVSAKEPLGAANPLARGVIVFRNSQNKPKLVKVTVTTKKNGFILTLTEWYHTNPDGSLGDLFSVDFK